MTSVERRRLQEVSRSRSAAERDRTKGIARLDDSEINASRVSTRTVIVVLQVRGYKWRATVCSLPFLMGEKQDRPVFLEKAPRPAKRPHGQADWGLTKNQR
jgi:hypothetical protein